MTGGRGLLGEPDQWVLSQGVRWEELGGPSGSPPPSLSSPGPHLTDGGPDIQKGPLTQGHTGRYRQGRDWNPDLWTQSLVLGPYYHPGGCSPAPVPPDTPRLPVCAIWAWL